MADTPPDVPSPTDTGEEENKTLSFANPSYRLGSSGRPRHLLPPQDEDDDSLASNGTHRHVYANSDYSSADVTPSSPDRSFILQKLSSPDEDDTDDDTSSLDDDSEMTHNLLGSREDVTEAEEKTYSTISDEASKKSRGILGYLAMLEQQAKGEVPPNKGERPDSPDDGLGAATPEEVPSRRGILGKNPALANKLHVVTDINSPDSHDSGIQSDLPFSDTVNHVRGPVTDDIYAIVDKKEAKNDSTPTPSTPDSANEDSTEEGKKEEGSEEQALPPGWQKHEDEDGPYYWHIKSGTIQRDPPPPAPPDGPTLCTAATVRSISVTSDSSSQGASSVPSTPTSLTSNTERHLQEFEGHVLQYAAKSLQSLNQQSEEHPAAPEVEGERKNQQKPVRFAVRSLGWVPIAQDDLTPERSSKAVNKCIMDLSLGRNDINDTVGRWGDGKDLYMDIDSHSLRLIDPVDFSPLNSQPIHTIRVWGVGRDNGRDFAYVARDRTTKTHMCHVFQCDTPARQIANTLRDICKRIMQERGLTSAPAEPRPSRPTDLPDLDTSGQHTGASLVSSVTFPTPMEEPRKVIRCHYLGSREVIRPTGMDMINESVEWQYHKVPAEKWMFVSVAIAPSTITITEHGNPDNILEECRVRFMSFMGISLANVKLCAFVMHTAQNKFMSHVFHCEPSAGPFCKTIEAACKLRYQKCLDAHGPQTPKSARNAKKLSTRLKKSMLCAWGSVTQLVSPK